MCAVRRPVVRAPGALGKGYPAARPAMGGRLAARRGGLEVDGELELRVFLNGKVGWFFKWAEAARPPRKLDRNGINL
jgi:hypothetical protein